MIGARPVDSGMPGFAGRDSYPDPEEHVLWFARIVGPERLLKRAEQLRRRFVESPFLRQGTIERHHVELCLVEALFDIRDHGELTQLEMPHRDAYHFAALANAVHERLSERGQRRHAGRLRDALKVEYGFAALRTEYTAMLFSESIGAKPIPMDLEGIERFDLLLESNEEQVELECKLLTHDFVAEISASPFKRLGAALEKHHVENLPTPGRSVIVRAEVDGLPNRDEELRAVATGIAESILQGRAVVRPPIRSLRVEDWPAGREYPERAHAEARFVMLTEGGHTMAFTPESAALVLRLTSASSKGRGFAEAVARKFKDAAEQRSGSRPGVIFAELEGPCLDEPVNARLAKMFERVLGERFFAQRPWIELVTLGFAGPPFSAGMSYPLRNPRRKTTKPDVLGASARERWPDEGPDECDSLSRVQEELVGKEVRLGLQVRG